MSVLWQTRRHGRTYEVRSAGRTRRLYVDGVLHTSWHRGRILTGSVWDPLALAGLLIPEGPRRVLLLGVGGGAAVHLLRALVAPGRIVGVERDDVILRVAKRWFELDGPDLDLACDDAVSWVRRAGRRRFQLVVDDLFGEDEGVPVRAAGTPADWWHRLERLVAPSGVLVVNFPDLRELTSSPVCQDVGLRRAFPTALRFAFPSYDNAVAVLSRAPITARRMRAAIAGHPKLQRWDERSRMRFKVRTLWPT